MAQYRAERLAHEIQRLLSELIQTELRDPRLRVATITRVEVSGDLRHAKVYASTLDEADRAAAAEALQHARGYMRSYLAAQLSMRIIPELHFIADNAISGGDRVLGMIRDLELREAVADD